MIPCIFNQYFVCQPRTTEVAGCPLSRIPLISGIPKNELIPTILLPSWCLVGSVGMALESFAEHEMEMPSVRLAVLGLNVVNAIPIVETDKTDGIDLKSCAEAIGAFKIEEVGLAE